MDKMKRAPVTLIWHSPREAAGLLLGIVLIACLLACPQWGARAQAPLEPTQILVGAPAQADLGSQVTVQAVLADERGRPIPGAQINFTTAATFLGTTQDVVLAQAVTNAQGQAVARFSNNLSGTITLRAEFAGDEQYAASNATTQIAVIGDGQVYSDNLGGQSTAAAPVQSLPLWLQILRTEAGGLPLAAALLMVWSMYVVAVGFIIRIAALAKTPEPGTPAMTPDQGRSS
jgi:hypothetical protein